MGGLAKPKEQSDQQASDIHSKSVTRQGQTRRSERPARAAPRATQLSLGLGVQQRGLALERLRGLPIFFSASTLKNSDSYRFSWA
jgi:hypothetical protein